MVSKKNTSDVLSVTSTTKNQHHTQQYVCVHCSCPCAALYRRLSVSLSSIKALTCNNCNMLVDPYIEREWLLVVIDCILLREEAFRHVLFNVDELHNFPVLWLCESILARSILDTYLKWHAMTICDSDRLLQQSNQLFQLAPILLSSAFEIMFQWFVMQLVQSRQEHDKRKKMQLLWGLLLPTSFCIVTIFVSMWENTKTVRMLGSLLVASWQGVAIWVVTKDLYTPTLGLLAGILWRHLFTILFTPHFPCLGLEIEILGQNRPICIT